MELLTLVELFDLFQSHAARKFFDRSGRAAAGKLRDHLDDGPKPSAAVEAARGVVEASRDAVKSKYWSGEDDLSRRVTSFLARSSFVDEVVGRLLLSDQPDLDRLKTFYLKYDENSSEEWKSLEEPLSELIAEIEMRLDGDPYFGALRRDLKVLARLEKISDWQEKLAGFQELMLAEQKRTTKGVEEIKEELKRQGPVDLGDLTVEEHSWLRGLVKTCDDLPLAHDPRDFSDSRAELSRVYIDPLTTTWPSPERICERLHVPKEKRGDIVAAWEEQGERFFPPREEFDENHPLAPWVNDQDELNAAMRPLSVDEAFAGGKRTVLLGDPGSGKSTVVNQVTRGLALARLGEIDEPFAEALFPIRIILRKWSTVLTPGAEGLQLFDAALEQLGSGVPLARLRERLNDGGVFLLFDGLDEVPTAQGDETDRRALVLAAIEAAAHHFPRCRIAVTCRVKPWDGARTQQLVGWPVVRLAPLDEERQARFCELWYAEQSRIRPAFDDEEAGQCRDRLVEAIGKRPRLAKMAETPLLLTMLAQVNARRFLPEGRAELYEECVQQLLWVWEEEKRKIGGGPSLARLLQTAKNVRQVDVERVLWRLAFEAHEDCGQDQAAEIPEAVLIKALAHLPEGEPDWAWAAQVVGLWREREGLLVEPEPGVFSFPHRSFQEYLACRWLLEQNDNEALALKLCGKDVWHEVVELACGELGGKGRFGRLESILLTLLGSSVPSAGEWGPVVVAGRAWSEFGPHRSESPTAEILRDRMPERLRVVMQDGDVAPKQRLEAGLLAADFGDVHDEFDAWVEFPESDLGYAFSAGKYPVTNAEFARFVEDGGYETDRPWWTELAKEEIQKFWGSWPDAPRFWSASRWNRPTQPVVAISWHEASAYCAWLTARLRNKGFIADDQVVRLPTEQEWMWAALEGEDKPFPMSVALDDSCVNYRGTLNQTTPVHLYPQGVSQEGVYDLIGNTWEWLAEPFGERVKVLCGKAYYSDKIESAASARIRSGRDYWNVDVGFRIFLVPVSRANSDS